MYKLAVILQYAFVDGWMHGLTVYNELYRTKYARPVRCSHRKYAFCRNLFCAVKIVPRFSTLCHRFVIR